MIKIPSTAKSAARPATEEEIQREQDQYYLANDSKDYLQSDILDFLIPNVPEFGYTNPNLHRRIDEEANLPTSPMDNDRSFLYVTDLTIDDSEVLLSEDGETILASRYGDTNQMNQESGEPDYRLPYTTNLTDDTSQNVLTEDNDPVLASRYESIRQMQLEGGTPDYLFINYDENGNPYRQSIKLGVWDGLHSYRTTTTYTHDEESTTCEIP